MEFEEQGMPSQEKITETPSFLQNHFKLILVLGLFLLVAMLLTTVLIPKNPSVTQLPKPSIITPPVVIVTATPPLEPSQWATDAAILQIDEQNKNLAEELLNVDLTESPLALPNIDTNVTFEK
ncbi:hypothetical protein HY345_04305 [Candidatus Microgenomates bacterium]|nr:hypothetical protein [Candidatus Microgenomates bacterium]